MGALAHGSKIGFAAFAGWMGASVVLRGAPVIAAAQNSVVVFVTAFALTVVLSFVRR
jgi:hypothetical protein